MVACIARGCLRAYCSPIFAGVARRAFGRTKCTAHGGSAHRKSTSGFCGQKHPLHIGQMCILVRRTLAGTCSHHANLCAVRVNITPQLHSETDHRHTVLAIAIGCITTWLCVCACVRSREAVLPSEHVWIRGSVSGWFDNDTGLEHGCPCH